MKVVFNPFTGKFDYVVTSSDIDNSEWDSAYTHIGESGASHTYINQDVQTTASPTFAGLDCDGAAVFNEAGADVDFRIEGVGKVNALFVQGSDGKIGIGTNAPSYALHVKSSDAFTFKSESDNASWSGFEILATASEADPYLQFNNSADSELGWIQLDSSSQKFIWHYDSNLLTLTKTGKLGLGVSPSNLLDIEISGIAYERITTTANNEVGLKIRRNETAGSFNDEWLWYIPASSTDFRLYNGSDLFTIKANGNVGIGTNAPNTKLEVATTTAADGMISGSSFMGVWNDGSKYAVFSHKNFRVTDSDTKYAFIQNNVGESYFNSATILKFLVAGATKASITNGLIVGSPTGGDKGAGTINAKAVYDDNVLLTDYVFDKYFDNEIKEEDIEKGVSSEYTIPTREEFIEHIKTKKHLPRLTGRLDWTEENRPSLGKFQSQLCEQVEHLALYIKELHEENVKIKERIILLEKLKT